LGQDPGRSDITSGCMGQVYSVASFVSSGVDKPTISGLGLREQHE